MAFSFIVRRSACSFAPLAVRALRSQLNCHFAIFTALNQTRIVSSEHRLSPLLPPARSYSTKWRSSDGENLLRLLDSEIQRAEEIPMVEQAPDGFPFKIEDKPEFDTITLSRKYEGEEIKVEVSRPERVTSDDKQDYNDERASIPLVISVAKGNGQFIEFDCTAYPDKLDIDSLGVVKPENYADHITYEGGDKDSEELVKALHKYLEIRGIKPSMTNFLHKYMINKDSRVRLMWLKNLKKFVEA